MPLVILSKTISYYRWPNGFSHLISQFYIPPTLIVGWIFLVPHENNNS